MITEDYVSFETAKLLKEKGFKEWCSKCYGVAVLHNGADISFDEECDLKDYGREDEIEYVEGGRLYDYGCNNSDKDIKVWAAPTLWVAMKWLREVHSLYLDIVTSFSQDSICYTFSCSNTMDLIQGTKETSYHEYQTYEEACEAGIKYCLENLI